MKMLQFFFFLFFFSVGAANDLTARGERKVTHSGFEIQFHEAVLKFPLSFNERRGRKLRGENNLKGRNDLDCTSASAVNVL